MNETDRKQIMDLIIRMLELISNKERQMSTWMQGKGIDFDETVCIFLDELEPVLENYEEFGITAFQYPLLKKLGDEFDLFSRKNSLPELFIDTPEWTKITEMAKEALNVLKSD